MSEPVQLLVERLQAKRSGDGWKAKCPNHDDREPSISISEGADGRALIKCHAGCQTNDILAAIDLKPRDLFVSGKNDSVPKQRPPQKSNAQPFNWQQRVDAFTEKHIERLSDWRGYSGRFCSWLHTRGLVGVHDGCIAFPVHDKEGHVIAAHCRSKSDKWFYKPGAPVQPFIIGDLKTAKQVHSFESQWDMFSLMDRTELYLEPTNAFVATRGAENAKLIKGLLREGVSACAWPQNDEPGKKWLKDLAKHADVPIAKAIVPAPHKDMNKWCQAGATAEDIYGAFFRNELVEVPEIQELPEVESIPAQLVPLWARTPDPSSAEVRGQIISILTDKEFSLAKKRIKIADAVVDALARRGQFFFDIGARNFKSTMFFDRDRKRLEQIASDPFHAWLSDWLRTNRADPIFTHVIREIETVALSEKYSKGIGPDKFWASRPGAIYLSNGDAAFVKITAHAVQLMDNGADKVLFAAGNTLAPWKLIEPLDPFETCSAFKGANCAASHGLDLLRLVTSTLPSNPAKKPPLCFVGPIGSGKTRLAEAIAELYGIPFVANNVSEIGDDDFWVSADAGGLFTLDNCDTHIKWLADAVAAHATGGHRDKRKLYTDSEKVTLHARAWLCLTTANPTLASDAGLADRLLVVRMNRRDADTEDSKLSAEIKEHRDAGLSFIAQTLGKALADSGPVQAKLNLRHPDFATLAIKIGRAIDRETQAINALASAERDKFLFCLENDFVAAPLLDYLDQKKTFTGTASELRDALTELDPGFINKDGKPSAKSIGRRLQTLWPYLTSSLPVATKDKDRTRTITYTFTTHNAEFAES